MLNLPIATMGVPATSDMSINRPPKAWKYGDSPTTTSSGWMKVGLRKRSRDSF